MENNYSPWPTAVKAMRGAVFAGALLWISSPDADRVLGDRVPPGVRVVVVGSVLPAVRNYLKAKLGVELGGVL